MIIKVNKKVVNKGLGGKLSPRVIKHKHPSFIILYALILFKGLFNFKYKGQIIIDSVKKLKKGVFHFGEHLEKSNTYNRYLQG